ncbi:hypothetical protein CNA08015 [Cryptococcus deneoformans JEC21]|uniref:Uncharacterized protein n=1 Tax=Cryptococcus deneoformans (strain JEC21 / ATCC MYA-565) TaxID=214684 RepID=A0A0S2LI20_CRYD1|nr:hypothetical protein CNA08015 [Cryptococcus neoformans var. neoformans JEC21]ALO60367.1 hypothetical protein CNA08015 [Cryptococcus neoformans var. neoformans JEC21]
MFSSDRVVSLHGHSSIRGSHLAVPYTDWSQHRKSPPTLLQEVSAWHMVDRFYVHFVRSYQESVNLKMNPSSLRLPKPMKKDQMLPIQKDTSRWKGSYDILFLRHEYRHIFDGVIEVTVKSYMDSWWSQES